MPSPRVIVDQSVSWGSNRGPYSSAQYFPPPPSVAAPQEPDPDPTYATFTVGDRVNYAPSGSSYLAYAAPWSLFTDATAGIAGYVASSTTQLTLGPATHSLDVGTGKLFVPGGTVIVNIRNDPVIPDWSANMQGTVVSYTGSTLVMLVTESDPVGGPGTTSTHWDVRQKAVEGLDYLNQITVTPELWPNRTTFYSKWPNAAGGGDGARGYNSINHGNGNRAVVGQPIQAVPALGSVLKHHFKWSLVSGAPDNYNVLGELYPTSVKDNHDTKTAEVAFFPYAPQGTINYANDGDQWGIFTDSDGVAWRVGRQVSGDAGNFIMMIPSNGLPLFEGTLHYDEAIAWLHATGRQNFSSDWVNGSMFGIEPKRGEATVYLESFLSVMQ